MTTSNTVVVTVNEFITGTVKVTKTYRLAEDEADLILANSDRGEILDSMKELDGSSEIWDLDQTIEVNYYKNGRLV